MYIKPKKGKVWALSSENFKKLVQNSSTFSEILRKLGLGTANYSTLKKRIAEESVDDSHIVLRLRREYHSSNKIPLEKILVINSTYNHGHLKSRLISENLLQPQCYKCKIGTIWNQEPLTLQLDHINGVNNDNRIENLQLLCPNCHSQTSTWSGRNIQYVKTTRLCSCGRQICKSSLKCQRCYLSTKKTKIDWPSFEKMKKLLSIHSTRELGKILGVSDNAIHKRMAKFR
jgi:hypothetical protein